MPTAYMPGWSRWMGYINPLAYSFEALMANEFHGREFSCARIVPQGSGYEGLPPESRICSVVGSGPGSLFVNGDRYINLSFDYYYSHKWRNVCILCGFIIFFFITYLRTAELSRPPRTMGEVLVFRRGPMPPAVKTENPAAREVGIEAQEQGEQSVVTENGEENVDSGLFNDNGLAASRSAFHWEDFCYDIKVKGGANRHLLDHVDGWFKPGISTALMASNLSIIY
jgi:ATP-binding cassette, subfamily G (WHITE), member 2, PDR